MVATMIRVAAALQPQLGVRTTQIARPKSAYQITHVPTQLEKVRIVMTRTSARMISSANLENVLLQE